MYNDVGSGPRKDAPGDVGGAVGGADAPLTASTAEARHWGRRSTAVANDAGGPR
jgi:hypothetical protein